MTDSNATIVFVSAQGTEFGGGSGVYAVDKESKEIVWAHTDFHRKYFDVDPLNETHILISAQKNESPNSQRAFIIDWRNDTVESSFPIPEDTHDVDRISADEFVVADKADHRVYVYNRTNKSVVWEFDFTKRFPPSAGGPRDGDWTHLNDVDEISGGEMFLVSPRNFDRVMVINRSDKSIEFTLGEEENHSIIYAQHNPVLLQSSPEVVLVADSENHRVVEYEKTESGWKQTWGYENVRWPRDADRLPNGDTLITDTYHHRVIIVSEDGDLEWERKGFQKPYDSEIVELGDEPTGPHLKDPSWQSPGTNPIEQFTEKYYRSYYFVSWILPTWLTLGLYPFLILGCVSLSMSGCIMGIRKVR